MSSEHRIIYGDSRHLDAIEDASVDLVVTSPPYPMIEMWDGVFSSMNPAIRASLLEKDGVRSFNLMHEELAKTWNEVRRVLKEGGFACINIGDATRSIDGKFALYPSSSRIAETFFRLGFDALPSIIWRKQTNSPNKFLGSGMLPAGAYPTLEHEFIHIFRKYGKREFLTEAEKENRRQSAYFWEERNTWFSDIWVDLKGTRQETGTTIVRERSGAYPFELAFRLVNMFSVKGDIVLDPFLGTGTTTLAAMSSERNSVGLEIDSNFKEIISERIRKAREFINDHVRDRVSRHSKFVDEQLQAGQSFKYHNSALGMGVKEGTEEHIIIRLIDKITVMEEGGSYIAEYRELKPQENLKNLTLSDF